MEEAQVPIDHLVAFRANEMQPGYELLIAPAAPLANSVTAGESTPSPTPPTNKRVGDAEVNDALETSEEAEAVLESAEDAESGEPVAAGLLAALDELEQCAADNQLTSYSPTQNETQNEAEYSSEVSNACRRRARIQPHHAGRVRARAADGDGPAVLLRPPARRPGRVRGLLLRGLPPCPTQPS